MVPGVEMIEWFAMQRSDPDTAIGSTHTFDEIAKAAAPFFERQHLARGRAVPFREEADQRVAVPA